MLLKRGIMSFPNNDLKDYALHWRLKLGISSCLLGNRVRYDGRLKQDLFISHTLKRHAELVPVCPEVECGLPVPRESMTLWGSPGSPRLRTNRSGRDHTDRLRKWAGRRAVQLQNQGISGFILKSRSPSCGTARVRIYDKQGRHTRKGTGIFVMLLTELHPLLPVESDERFHDPLLRETFFSRLFVLKRWREMVASGRNPSLLTDFHARHELLIQAHSPKHSAAMKILASRAAGLSLPQTYSSYLSLLLEALALRSTVPKNTSVLKRAICSLQGQLSSDDKMSLSRSISDYQQGMAPRIVPVTLLNHYAHKHDQPDLKKQYYLNPDPVELKLRTIFEVSR